MRTPTSWTCALAASLLFVSTLSAEAADKRYPISYVQKVEVTAPSGRTAWENKDFLNCDDVVLTEADVLFALRHMRRVSRSAYDPERMETTGCEGSATVTFKNGKSLAMGIEPNGRTLALEYDGQMKLTESPTSFYECAPCGERKMALLKDALNRADERRLKKLVAEGRLSASEAEFRLKRVRDERDKP
ncbi:hypothetical protein EJP69_03990 [Variovorax gossypii]|uniref:Uncharacterized protein n=1 Tax=Variovorax gossypii TaxID=1679495 RepID=A0A431TRT6_9BURK|nr:hypothetical protein [Variovorax gossypii]RTQ36909.1 hypothetical protein EJP69_03990 [Variovorax gossypii]